MTIGVMRPESVATATDMSTFLNSLIYSSCHYELVSGTSVLATDAALMTMSFTLILVSEYLFNFCLIHSKLSISTSTDR